MFLLSLIMFTVGAFAQAPPPVSVKGQSGAKLLPKWNLQVPNVSATNLGGTDVLLETGNTNLLANPSFEHATFDTGWTCTGITPTAETTVVAPGSKKSMKLTMSASTFECYQEISAGATYAADVQFLAATRLKAAVTSGTIKVCVKQAGTTSTSLCETNVDDTFNFRKVPFKGDTTSNGISIVGTSVTGTAYIDDAFVGPTEVKQETNVIGPWQSYTPTFTGFGTVTCASCMEWRQVGSNIEIRGKFVSGVATATEARMTLPNSYTASVPTLQKVGAAAISSTVAVSNEILAEAATAYLTFGVQGAATGGLTKQNGSSTLSNGVSMSILATVPITNLIGSISTYSTQNADTGWESCGHVAGDFTGFGTMGTIDTQCKRDGSDLLMKGKFTIGVGSGVEARMALKFRGQTLTSANTSTIPSVQKAGEAVYSVVSASMATVLIEPNVTYATFGIQSSSAAGITKTFGNTFTSSLTLVLNARIPIATWENSNVIIGSFNGLETCADTLECTDTLKATSSSLGAISLENVDFINGNCTVASTNQFTCPFVSGIFTSLPLCDIQITGTGGDRTGVIESVTTSAVVFRTFFDGTGASPAGFNISCSKTGVDFIGKTAKAVASDQNVRTPGIVGSVRYSAKMDSAGGITDNFGGLFSSCTGTLVKTCTFAAGKITNGINCNITRMGPAYSAGWVYSCAINSLTTTGIVYDCGRSSASTAAEQNASAVTLSCDGY